MTSQARNHRKGTAATIARVREAVVVDPESRVSVIKEVSRS